MVDGAGGRSSGAHRGVSAVCLILTGLLTTSVACSRGEEHLRRGHVLLRMGLLDEAEAEFKRVLDKDSKDAAALEGVADVALERGDLVRAEKWYRRAIVADPAAVTAYHQLARTLAAKGNLGLAVDVLTLGLKIVPKNPQALSMVGELHERLGDRASAERFQLSALEVNPAFNGARSALANLLIESGRLEEADKELTRLAAHGGAGSSDYGFARLEAKAGRPARAAHHLDAMLARGVAEPGRILVDPIFKGAWSDPAMSAIRERILAAGGAPLAPHPPIPPAMHADSSTISVR